jgi:outer membrane beta-barrel protein
MHTTRKLFIVAAAASAVYVIHPQTAQARKKGPLEGEPVVRQKLDLRKYRLEVTPLVAMSLSQPFVHMGYAGGRLAFHFTDWIGIRAGFAYGVIPVESKLLKDINSENGLPGDETNPRPSDQNDNPAPLIREFRAGLTRAQWQSSADVVFTPFAGKMGLFSAIFTEYDIYVFGGLGLMGWQKHYSDRSTSERLNLNTDVGSANYCAGASGAQNDECLLHPVKADKGIKVGGSFGAGLNLFITDWVAINLEVQDIVTRNNIAGLNTTVSDIPPRVDKNDKDIFHNVTLQLGATFYFPPKAKRTK